jgi:hypothetical protein
MQRVLIGGTLCLLFGMVFLVAGIVNGDGSRALVGVPGILLGAGSLVSYRLNKNEPR